MVSFWYSKWDGSQDPFGPDSDDLLDEVAEGLFEHGDLQQAIRDLFREGAQRSDGSRMRGLQDMLRQLFQRRNEQLQRNNLDSVMDDIRERLESVVNHEREGADRSVSEAQERLEQAGDSQRQQLDGLMDLIEKRAQETLDKLDALPENVGGQIRELSDHEFIDDTARQEFNELMDMLRQQMTRNIAGEAAESMKNMSPEQQQALREMLKDLNQMMRDKLSGNPPNFQQFMDKWGQMFGDDPPQSFDELLDRMQQQMAQMQSLLAGMSKEERRQLAEALNQSLDPETLRQMAETGALMQALRPPDELAANYPFMGEESLTLQQAMEMMGELQQMDSMQQQIQQAAQSGDMSAVDPEQLEALLGPEARRALEELQEIAHQLEEQGYARRRGDKWELTPKAMRKLAAKALAEVFGNLNNRGALGDHRMTDSGVTGEPTGGTRKYEFGEEFRPNLQRSVMNAVERSGTGTPVHMKLDDFEVDRLERSQEAATVLLIDQSSSMTNGERWGSAKKVALALQSLINGQFPRDSLSIIGFSDHAEEIKVRELPEALPNNWLQGTNMHHALMLARRKLAKEPAAIKQVIMITDGEPTAHLENGYPYFDYPPSSRTISLTLSEVRRCTAAGIIINTFMLERTPFLVKFIEYVTRINRGRAFFTSPGRLGDYVLLDFMSNRRKRVA